MNRKLRIMMVTNHGCIRVIKQSIVLMDAGHIVHLVAKRECWGHWITNMFSQYRGRKQLRSLIANSTADIFHVHNEPDWMVKVVKDYAGNRPVIHDCHDLLSLASDINSPGADRQLYEETEAFKVADGFIHVTETNRVKSEELYGSDKPTQVIHTYMPDIFMIKDRDVIPTDSVNFRNAVYEGGLNSTDPPSIENITLPDGKIGGRYKVNIRYWLEAFKKFRSEGYNITCYPAARMKSNKYQEIGCFVCDPIPYPTLLVGLRAHGIGIVGSVYPVPYIDCALPNKLFEYMSQGVVPVVINCKETAEFVTKYDCGVVIKDLNDLSILKPDVLRQKRENVLKLRHKLTMESQLDKIESLYEEVLDAKGS